VVIDARLQYPFEEGCAAVVSVGTPLRVLRSKKAR
jgi:hypothetical protein